MNIHESNHMTTYTVLSNFLSRLVTIDRHENPDLGTDGEIRLSFEYTLWMGTIRDCSISVGPKHGAVICL